MRMSLHRNQTLDVSSVVGMVAGMGLLLPAYVVPDLWFLALPAFLILVPSLLFGMR